MATLIDEFPHHGDHLSTDGQQATVTIELLAVFVILTALLAILALAG